MLNTASWVAGGKEALIKMKASENVQHQFREFRFSVLGADGTELELKPKLHQFLASDIVNTFYVVFAAENNSNNIFATSNQINVAEPYSLAENEYLARVTVSNHGKTAIFSGPTSLFEVANAGHYTWASYQPDSSGADPAIHVQFSADKDPGKITKVKVTARYKRADLLSYNGFTKAIEGATVLEVPLTMDVSHKDEESGKVYVNISATGSEAQKADVAAGVQESKDYTDEKLKELLDSLYPPVNGTTTLTVYASGDKTWWHFNSLEIYLASGQRLYPLYYENVNTGGAVNQIKLIFTKSPSASLTLQNTAFFSTYELKDGEYSGALLTAESFGQTTTQSNNASSNIFSTDNYGLYVVPTASESAAFGIEITGELQQIAKISLRSPRQSSYVPPKIRATCVFDGNTLNAPEVETNSDISATFVFPFAEEAAGDGEEIDLSNYVTLDGAESITGVKTFTAIPVITNAPAADTDAVNKAYVDQTLESALEEGGAIDDAINDAINGAVGDTSNYVTLDGTQSITGVKTFSAVPIITNAPAADNEAANKAYVDSLLASSGGGDSCTAENMYAASLGEMFDRVGYKNRFIISNICTRANSTSAFSNKYFMLSNAYLSQYTDKDQVYPKFQVLRKTPCSVIPAKNSPYIFDSASSGFYYTQYFVARTNNVPDQSVDAPASPDEITEFSEKDLFNYICCNASAPKINYQQGAYTNSLGFTDDAALVFRVMVRNMIVCQQKSTEPIDLSAMFCKYGAFSTLRPFSFSLADFSSGQDLQNGSNIKDDISSPYNVSNLSAIYIDVLKYQSQNSSNSRYESIHPVYRFGCTLYSAYAIDSGSANTSSFKADICGVFGDSFVSKTVNLAAKDISSKQTVDTSGLLNLSNYGQSSAEITAYSVKDTSSYLWNLVGLKNHVDDLETRLKALESS